MIIIMKPGASKDSVQYIASYIQEKGLQAHVSTGSEVTIIGVVGDKTRIQGDNLEIFEGSNHGKLQAFQPKIPPRAVNHSGGQL